MANPIATASMMFFMIMGLLNPLERSGPSCEDDACERYRQWDLRPTLTTDPEGNRLAYDSGPPRHDRRGLMLRFVTLVALALSLLSAAATAADYPARAVKWVVPYPVGGSTDVLARLISQWLAEKLGQPFVVENKSGG